MKTLFVVGGITPDMQTALTPHFTLIHKDSLPDPAAWLDDNGDQIDYVITNGHDGLPTDLMVKMPNLALISNYGVGYDAIDTTAAKAQNIIVTHTPGVLSAEVATTAVMLMLACYRQLGMNEAHLRSGKWESEGNTPLTHTADGRTVGILGLGRIGMAIAAKLCAFDARILYHGRGAKDVPYTYCADLADMAGRADVLICCAQGGADTANLINDTVIRALGADGVLINVSRGSVVDEPALIAALRDGGLGWAGLDVFADEPRVPEALRILPNTVLTPHIASGTVETRQAMGQLTIDNLLAHVAGRAVITPVPEMSD